MKKKKSARKKKANPTFLQVMKVSPKLAKVIGKSSISRPQAIKVFWAYVKKNNLQDNKDRRNINLDSHLKPLFGGKKQVNMFEAMEVISKNMKKNKTRSKITSQKELFRNSTENAIKICKLIHNKEIRKNAIAVIKAANGKRIRNTSGV